MVNIKKIQNKMSELNMTKAQLIKNSGLTRVTIDKILAGGKINVDTLEALAQGLGVKVGYFFDEVNDVQESATSGDGGASATNHGHAFVGYNQTEHDELIKLRVEEKAHKKEIADKDAYYKAIIESMNKQLSEKDARIAELQKMVDYLMKGK